MGPNRTYIKRLQMTKPHIDVTQEAGMAFFKQNIQGPVVMLNMLRFKEEADYSNLAHLAPNSTISGQAAYDKYMECTMPFLKDAGSEILFYGESNSFLIGPTEEKWDRILLVKHAGVAEFMKFAQKEGYLKIAGHRTAALADSRLLPIIENNSY